MQEGFEEKFMEIQSGLISLCLELTQGKVDKIYAYASVERKSLMFNAFFEKHGEIITLFQLENILNIPDKVSWDFLKIGTNDLDKIRKLCEQYEAQTPREMKMYYDVKTGKYNADYRYEEVCSPETDLSAGMVFDAWLDEVKNKHQ